MRSSVPRALTAVVLLAGLGCREAAPKPAADPASVAYQPQVAGSLALDGLNAPVSIVRDRWGVPHVTASTTHDLFFAQGFVQAQDRLFQMDVWRRSAQGRLSEVLGANFIERDAMTRRMQYRGGMDGEWASYGPELRMIAEAFVQGVNAQVQLAQDPLPEEFLLAGWRPEAWRPADVLNRTSAFTVNASAEDDVFRARLFAAVGTDVVARVLPVEAGGTRQPAGVDLTAITFGLSELLRRIGPPPVFAGFAAPFRLHRASREDTHPPMSFRDSFNPSPHVPTGLAWAAPADRTIGGAPLVALSADDLYEVPSAPYLIHLKAPGWNVAGTAVPWLPGIVNGHNQDMAWAMVPTPADVQDVYVERTNPQNPQQYQSLGRWVDMDREHDAIEVKGRSEPFEYDRLYTKNGVIIGVDRERHLAYTVRWTGTEPGAASELAASTLNRTRSSSEFRSALERWKTPVADFVFADRTGVHTRRAGLIPIRMTSGSLPLAGWNGLSAWRGWQRGSQPESPVRNLVVVGDAERQGRVHELTPVGASQSAETFMELQRDVMSPNAARLVPLLESIGVSDADVAAARQRLLSWDRTMSIDSDAAALFSAWESALGHKLAEYLAPPEFVDRLAAMLPVVDLLVEPQRVWPGPTASVNRDALIRDALALATTGRSEATESNQSSVRQPVTFRHVLAISDASRRWFNVGPFSVPGNSDTIWSVKQNRGSGALLKMIVDVGDWDRTMVSNAPGQSGWPASTHFSDLAALWQAGRYFPLVFTEEAIRTNAESTLILAPPAAQP